MSFKRILIAIDDSPIAAHAANVGFDLARGVHGDVALITVIDPSRDCVPDSGLPVTDLIAFAEQDCRHRLDRIAARSEIQPPPLSFASVGKPGAEIVKAAKDWHADVIVLGSHAHAGVGRVVVGRVAEAVMCHAPCPVLVVRSGS